MKIETGQLAPAFTAKTYKGESIDLAAFKGKKVWVAFYRWASCPLCNLRITEVLYRYKEFEEAGIQLVGVFQSAPETIARYVGRQDPPFPLVADPEMELYEQYGVFTSFGGMLYPRVFVRAFQALMKGLVTTDLGDGPKARVPADFLLDPEGLVYQSYYGTAISDHIPFEDVMTFAADPCLDMPERSVV